MPNNWVLGHLALAIVVQVLGKYMNISWTLRVGLGFQICSVGSRVEGLWCRVLGFKVCGVEF